MFTPISDLPMGKTLQPAQGERKKITTKKKPSTLKKLREQGYR